MSQLQQIKHQGFDRSRVTRTVPFRSIHVACSQCEALVINGVACHETGCPRQMFACKGCNNMVPRRGQYCQECQS